MLDLANAISKGSWPTDRQWIAFLQSSLLGLTDEKVREKAIFAFFLDKASPETAALFPTLQYCAGSLTEELFAKTLLQLLESNPDLSLPSIQVIRDFISAIKETERFNFFVDATRSKNPFLLLLIKTGSSFWGNDFLNLHSKASSAIDQFVQKMDQEVHALKIGEKRLFLLGSFVHETRLYVERKESEKFLFAYFDPAVPSTLEYSYRIDREKASGDAFWRPLCESKLECQVSSRTISDHLKSHLKSQGDAEKQAEIAILKVQKQNSCHFRSIMGPLKWQLYLSCRQHNIDFALEWHAFKIAFGRALLPGLASNAPLQKHAQKRALVHLKKQELELAIQEAKKDPECQIATICDLKKILSLFVLLEDSFKIDLIEEDPDVKLEPLARKCRQVIKKSLVSLEPYSALFMNSVVAKAIFDIHLLEREERGSPLTKAEIRKKSLFLPAASSLFKKDSTENWHRQVGLYLEYLHQNPNTPYKKLFHIALDQLLGTIASFLLQIPEEPTLLLTDSSWVSIASKYSQTSESSLIRTAIWITKALVAKKYRENPNLHWGDEVELLTSGFDEGVRSQAKLGVWFYGYEEKGLFLQISTIRLDPEAGPIFTGFIRSGVTLRNYLEAYSFLKNEQLHFDLITLCFGHLAGLALQEQKSSLFFELFVPVFQRARKNYLGKISDEALRFLFTTSVDMSLDGEFVVLLLIEIVNRACRAGYPLKKWAETAPTFYALSEEVRAELIQALNREGLSKELKTLKIIPE